MRSPRTSQAVIPPPGARPADHTAAAQSRRIAARYAAREKKALAAEQRRFNRIAEQAALGTFEAAQERGDDAAMANAVPHSPTGQQRP
jgi:hypothetical protein